MGLIRDLQLKRIKLGETRLSERYELISLLKNSGVLTAYDLLHIKLEQMRAWRNQGVDVDFIENVAIGFIRSNDK